MRVVAQYWIDVAGIYCDKYGLSYMYLDLLEAEIKQFALAVSPHSIVVTREDWDNPGWKYVEVCIDD